MKLVILVEGTPSNFEKMVDIVKGRKSLFVDMGNCDEIKEYRCLVDHINNFSQSNDEIMLAKFSGRDSIVRNLGEELSEMIISISYNKKSKYYIECPIDMLIDLLKIFD